MQNRITEMFRDKSKMRLSIYFTAGFPGLHDTVPTIRALENAGVDFIEIGFPFSDPLADGPAIQESSQTALLNGMGLKMLFGQLDGIRKTIKVPLVLMGYLNPVLQYGMENFVTECARTGIDGAILPDLPVDIYTATYKDLFVRNNLSFIPLITPATDHARIRHLDEQTDGFIYMVSAHGTTGTRVSLATQEDYFRRVRSLNLKNPVVVGFGVQSADDIRFAREYCAGAIVGSVFIRHLAQGPGPEDIAGFVHTLKQSGPSF